MFKVVSVFRYLCFTCIILSTLYLFRNHFINFHSYSANILSSSRITLDDCINLNDVTNETYQCIKTKLILNTSRTTVCVHEVKLDRDVSGLLVSTGIWEEHLVTRVVRILSTYRQYGFFDIGANVGVYTMYAASLGCSNVISIECFRPNIERIRRAIQLENVQERVILVPRALYNESNVYLSLRANIVNNIGSQRLQNKAVKNEENPLIVKTFRFDDLLDIIKQRNIHEAIIKIDIETSEHFLCQTGENIFNQINIPFIMMEWANIKTIPAKADLIQRFFINRHYIPFDSVTCQQQVQTDYRLWKTQDIYWIKQNYTYLCHL